MNIKLPLVILSSIFVLSAFNSAFAQNSNVSIFTEDERNAIAFLLGNEEKIPQNVILRKNILFTFNKSKVKSKYEFNINEIANVITENNNVKTVIRAYTDTTGKATYNQKLSQKRANAVKKALIRYNVPSDMIRAIGYGESSKYSNATRYGRAKNRRAEIEIAKIQDQAVIKPIEIKPYEYREVEEPIKTEETIDTNNYSNSSNLLDTYSSYCSNLKNKINTYNSCFIKKDKPLAACEDSEKRSYGVAACALVMGGCKIASSYTNGFWESQATSQACGFGMAKIQGVEYSIDKALKVSLLSFIDSKSNDLIEEGLSTESDLHWLKRIGAVILGVSGKTIVYSVKIETFNKCVHSIENQCTSIRIKWEQENTNKNCPSNINQFKLENLKSEYRRTC